MTSYGLEAIPPLDDVLATAVVVSLPMRVRFRGITEREVVLVEGPAGWGEFGPFPEYDDAEAAEWLRSALESAWLDDPAPLRSDVPVNATVPAVDPDQVRRAGEISRCAYGQGEGRRTRSGPRSGRRAGPRRARTGASRAGRRERRVEHRRRGDGSDRAAAEAPLEYAEQPCATVPELVEVRRRLQDDVPGASGSRPTRASGEQVIRCVWFGQVVRTSRSSRLLRSGASADC